MSVAERAQLALEEVVVDDPDLEAALEARQAAREKALAARKAFEGADEGARAVAQVQLDAAEGLPVRCGRFVLAERETPGRDVAFVVDPKTRVSIRVAPQ